MTTEKQPSLMAELAKLQECIGNHRIAVNTANPELPKIWAELCEHMQTCNGLIARYAPRAE